MRTGTGEALPASETLPNGMYGGFSRISDHVIAVVLRSGGADVIWQNAELGADGQFGQRRVAARPHSENSLLLVCFDDDQVRVWMSGQVRHDPITLVDALPRRS